MFGDVLALTGSPVEIQHLRALGTIAGVRVDFVAARNGRGIGVLESLASGTTLRWKGPGSSTFGPSVDVSVDGTYVLRDGDDLDKYVRVTTWSTYLLPVAQSAQVFLADVFTNPLAGADITASEASAGATVTHTVKLENLSVSAIREVKVWLDAGHDSRLSISDDGAAFSQPTTEATALDFGQIDGGSAKTLWIKRTIAASTEFDPDILTQLHGSFVGW